MDFLQVLRIFHLGRVCFSASAEDFSFRACLIARKWFPYFSMFGNNIENSQRKLNSSQTEKSNVTKKSVFLMLKKGKHFLSVYFLIHSSENFFFKINWKLSRNKSIFLNQLISGIFFPLYFLYVFIFFCVDL